MTVAITEAITTLADAEQRFDLVRTEDEAFFTEWQNDLPDLTDNEQSALSELRRRYLYQRSESQLLEGTVTLLLVSPLLTVAGFYGPVRAEEAIQLTLKDGEAVLRGRIDVLVMLNRFWVVVVESKKTTLSAWTALPQTLAYLMANENSAQSQFAMVTNGDDILFVKLARQTRSSYAVSRVFSPFVSSNELSQILKILKQFGQIASEISV